MPPVFSKSRGQIQILESESDGHMKVIVEKEKIRTVNRRKKISADAIYQYVLMGPTFLVMALLTVVPVLYTFYNGLFYWNQAIPNSRRYIGLGNYIKMFTDDSNFWIIMKNTATQVLGTVSFQVVLGILLAFLFSREVSRIKLARSLYMIPMMTTPVIIGVIWRLMLTPDFGIVNYLFTLVGLKGPDWFQSPALAMIAIIISDVWLSTPFVTIIVLAGIQSLPREPLESAKIDGATSFRSFIYVIMPLLAPVIWVAILFRLIDAFKRFDSIYIMTAGGPGNSTETLNLYAYNNAFSYMDSGYSSALAMFLFILIAMISVYTINKIQNSESA